VVEGEALDVAVDIRLGSPHFGKWTSVVLSAELQNQIYVPVGFAHGFLALSDTVQFLYKCSEFYNPGDERGLAWNDPDLRIRWDTTAPIISTKDARYPPLSQVPREFLPRYEVR
jgi:dTDP-4-dehydrorhamnose 3,5-epimerase